MKNIIILIALCFATGAHAQTIGNKVIAAGGKTKVAGNVMLEYTVGEPVVKTFSSANNKITQGFHQPTITVARVLNNEDPDIIPDAARTTTVQPLNDFKVEVFPNPATDYIMVNSEATAPNTTWMLVDISGSVVYSGKLNEAENRIDLSRLANGKYFLTVRSEDGSINETFKLIKTN
jgi:hypothetical protein